MDIKILSSEEVEFKEKDVQRAFEHDLSKLEEGLELVDSEVIIGTGRIDTLAFDTKDGRPVFIEYKRRGEFGKDALIQLMYYLSWFAQDENRMAMLEKIIRKRMPEIDDFEPSIRLICVVTEMDDRIRNAIYSVKNDVKVFSYMVAHDTANNVVLVPKLELDNSDIEAQVPQTVSEQEFLSNQPHLRELFERLRSQLESGGASSYVRNRNSFGFKKDKVFGVVRFRKAYLHLELRVGRARVSDPDFKYARQGESSWGYTYVYPAKAIPEKVIGWIEAAKNFIGEVDEADEPEALVARAT
jgi:hypothetical protein